MPNHCVNTLYLPENAVTEIAEKYIGKNERGESVFDFEKIIPIGDVPDWHGQRREKWGTKWIGYDLSIGKTYISFLTAWSPPIPIVGKLAELHPEITFHLDYHEPGMGFRGEATARWNDGEVSLDDNCRDMTKEDLYELGLLDDE